MDPNSINNMWNAFFSNSILSNIVKWTLWGLLAVLIIAFFVVIYYYFQYKYKIYFPQLLYDSDGNSAQVLKFKKDRARIVKRKDGTRKTHYLFSRKWTEPLKQEDVKPGNRVYMMRINEDNTYTALPSFSLGKDGKPHEFEYLTDEQKTWVILELKETATSNLTEDAQKRIFTYTMIAIVIAFVFVAGMIWLTLRYTGGVVDALNNVAPTLANIAEGLGGGPS